MDGQEIATVVIGLTIVATLFGPIVGIVGANTGEVDVSNETAVASIGDSVDLDGYNVVADSETVEFYNGTDWVTATSGTDYELDDDAGAITALQGGSISDGDELRISYTYEASDGMTDTVAGLAPLMFALLMLVVLASKVEGAI